MAVGARDYYDVLGVPRDASDKDIRTAHRKLARENHPDVSKDPGAEDRFKEISEAYDVLRDPEKRAQYDRFGPNWRAASQAYGAGGPGPGPGAGSPGGAQGFGGFEGFDDGVHVDFDGDVGDLFSELFGGRAGGRTRRGGRGRSGRGGGGGGGGFEGFSVRGSDMEAEIEITLEEAFRGGKRRFTLSDGRDYEVDIPAGVRDGQRIRLAGQGGEGAGGGPAGDLFLRVRIRPDPRLRRKGDDLETDLPVTPSEAALGAQVPVPTLEGPAKVRVRAGSSCGTRLRLRGQGMPRRSGERGDLYAVVKIMVPKHLSDEERELYERLAAASDFDPRSER
jgi:curved DNA-binding protein